MIHTYAVVVAPRNRDCRVSLDSSQKEGDLPRFSGLLSRTCEGTSSRSRQKYVSSTESEEEEVNYDEICDVTYSLV